MHSTVVELMISCTTKGSSSPMLAITLGVVLPVVTLCCILFMVVCLIGFYFLRQRMETPTARHSSPATAGACYNHQAGLAGQYKTVDDFCNIMDSTSPSNLHDYGNLPRPPPRPTDFPSSLLASPQKAQHTPDSTPTPLLPLPPVPSTQDDSENPYESLPPPLYANQHCQWPAVNKQIESAKHALYLYMFANLWPVWNIMLYNTLALCISNCVFTFCHSILV